jgi:hypothetical protein
MFDENGKKSVKQIPVKIGSGYDDLYKSLVSGNENYGRVTLL